MNNKKRIYKEEKTTTIDNETGEIISEKTEVKASMVESEPPFVKLYIDDLLRLKDVPKASNDVLHVLVRNMSYGNYVVMIKAMKEQICKQTSLKMNTVNKAIQSLHKAGILIRKERSVYVIDPNLFAKGKWGDIKKLRLTIDYHKDGTKTINSNVAEQLKINM